MSGIEAHVVQNTSFIHDLITRNNKRFHFKVFRQGREILQGIQLRWVFGQRKPLRDRDRVQAGMRARGVGRSGSVLSTSGPGSLQRNV